jgi:hypothetical protein
MTSVELRIARPADALAVAKVHVRSWQVGYRDLLPHDYLDALRPEERAQRYTFGSNDPHAPTTIVAKDDGVNCLRMARPLLMRSPTRHVALEPPELTSIATASA